MRTKERFLFAVENRAENVSRLRVLALVNEKRGIGIDLRMDCDRDSLRDVVRMMVTAGDDAEPDWAEFLPKGPAKTLSTMIDEGWPGWRSDLQRLVDVGGRIRLGWRYVALKFGDGTRRRFENTQEPEGYSERMMEAIGEMTQALAGIAGEASGATAASAVATYTARTETLPYVVQRIEPLTPTTALLHVKFPDPRTLARYFPDAESV